MNTLIGKLIESYAAHKRIAVLKQFSFSDSSFQMNCIILGQFVSNSELIFIYLAGIRSL